MDKVYFNIDDLFWKEFENTGKVGYYMLYSAVKNDGDDDGIA